MATSISKKINQRAAKAIGPVYAGQVVDVEVEGDDGLKHHLVWLPDRNNDLLRKAGKPMLYYFLPKKPRLDRHSNNDFVFHLQKFSGVMDPNKNIGENGFSEVAGGCLTFTTTLAPPSDVLQKSFKRLTNIIKGSGMKSSNLYFLGNSQAVMGGPVQLNKNKTSMHALNFNTQQPDNPLGNDGNPGAWTFHIQGTGDSSLNVFGSNAFTVMMGNRPTQMLMDSAKSGTSQVTVLNQISYPVWSLVTEIEITGEWESIFDHLSVNAEAKWWFSESGFNKVVEEMVQDSIVEVKIKFGAGMVDAKQQENYEKSADAIADAFRKEIASKLANAEKNSTATEAKNKGVNEVIPGIGFGLAFDINSVKKTFKGSMKYKKTIDKQILRSETLSSQMTGLFNETSNNPETIKKYFSEVFFEEGFRKIHVVASANAYWGNEQETGDPIKEIQLEVGYPDSNGTINWFSPSRFKQNAASTDLNLASTFKWQKDTKDRLYVYDFTRHDLPDIEPEEIHLRKIISFKEHPRVKENTVIIEESTNQHIIEVRAESGGVLEVGPIGIDMTLPEDDKQIKIKVTVKTDTFGEETFIYSSKNSTGEGKVYKAWYAKPEDIENFDVKTEVIVKGRRFGQKSLRWESDWKSYSADGAFEAEVPAIPDDLEDKVNDYLGFEEE